MALLNATQRPPHGVCVPTCRCRQMKQPATLTSDRSFGFAPPEGGDSITTGIQHTSTIRTRSKFGPLGLPSEDANYHNDG